MGVVGRPVPHKKIDGKIHIKRVSKTVEVKNLTSHQNFFDDVIINEQIKNGGWRHLHSDGMIVDETREALQEQYLLDNAVIDHTVFICNTKVGNKGNQKSVSISEENAKLEGLIRIEDDPTTPGRSLTIADLTLEVKYRRGDTIETDCNCNSAYMLTAMDLVGKLIRDAYH